MAASVAWAMWQSNSQSRAALAFATTVSTADAATLARSLGADEAINSRCEETVAAYIDRLTAGHGFDVVFDT